MAVAHRDLSLGLGIKQEDSGRVILGSSPYHHIG